AKKCPYCDFFSEKYSDELASQYINSIINDMEKYKGEKADTLYFGGGTPGILKPQLIEKIINSAYKNFSLKGEITLETNPNILRNEWKSIGVNRLSVGFQSVNDIELFSLGRPNFKQEQLLKAREFENLSCDVMIGIPNQTKESLDKTLQALKIADHISAYMLIVEENTPFYKQGIVSNGEDYYMQVIDTLKDFSHYEISNFAKEGFESKHNMKYWQCEDYIGFGASAHSCYNGKRFYYKNDIKSYIDKPLPIITEESPYDIEEYIMLGLRLKKGICLTVLKEKYNVCCKKIIDMALSLKDFCVLKDDKIFLTDKGFLFSNSIIVKFLEMV
ncbi:MAG: coproporphyrinogen-III oxidase family protein, partial [Oscillospiraceae bacterium]